MARLAIRAFRTFPIIEEIYHKKKKLEISMSKMKFHDRIMESMEILSIEINMRLSKKLDSLMSMMHSQINRAISSAISDGVNPEIQNIMGSLSSGQRATESRTSVKDQDSSEDTVRLKTKITNKTVTSKVGAISKAQKSAKFSNL